MIEKPIYLQIKEVLEDNIIANIYSANDLVISSTQICKLFDVNPATAMRALSELTDEGILYKDRGIGMRVSNNASELLKERRKHSFSEDIVKKVIQEARILGMANEELISLIIKRWGEIK